MATIVHMNRPESFRLKWLKADNYIKQGDFSKAIQVFEELAEEGYSEAYVEIGNLFEQGGNDKLHQDLGAARHWYMRAVEDAHDPYGYIGLARLALNGYVDAGSFSDAIEYLNIAATENNPVALTMLGSLYHSGKFVPKDLRRAAELYEKASAHGYVLPIAYLARLCWERGQYLTALRYRLNAIRSAYNIAKNDRSDPRLWNYL